VVGDSKFAGDVEFHGFSWTAAGGMVDLGPVSGFPNSSALFVNNNGQVVGESYENTGGGHATVWTTRR
jgi:uncharacterized membrane protein